MTFKSQGILTFERNSNIYHYVKYIHNRPFLHTDFNLLPANDPKWFFFTGLDWAGVKEKKTVRKH